MVTASLKPPTKPPTGAEDQRKLTVTLFLDDGWREGGGGEALLYEFDHAAGTFRARQLPPTAGTLLVTRSDRVLYGAVPARAARYSMSFHVLGHYT